MLTHGQAACLVLDKHPTIKNRKRAKMFFARSPLTVVYLANGNPLEPMIVAKSVANKNPYKYKWYPPVITGKSLKCPASLDSGSLENDVMKSQDVPIPSRQNLTVNLDFPSNGSDKDTGSTNSKKTRRNTTMTATIKSDILRFLKATYHISKPDSNSDEYDLVFLTNKDLYKELAATYPQFENTFSLSKFCICLNKEIATFGPLKARRVGRLVEKGRMLWKSRHTAF